MVLMQAWLDLLPSFHSWLRRMRTTQTAIPWRHGGRPELKEIKKHYLREAKPCFDLADQAPFNA
jgi:hypothetical protein